jgi:GDP-L-fucose synthase
VAAGILRAGEVYERPELVNLSMGRNTSVKDVVELLAGITGFRGQLVWDKTRPEGQPDRCMDSGKARQELGFSAATDLREGLALTARWYRENQARARTLEVPRLA